MNELTHNTTDTTIARLSSVGDRLVKMGFKDEEKCAATSILVDHHIEHINVNSDQVEILPLAEALKKYDWVQDLMYGLIKPQYDEMLQQLTENTEKPLGYFVKVQDGAKVELPMQLFTILQTPQARQHIHNIMVIGEDAEVDVISGAVVPESLRRGKHVSISETYVGKNAQYRSVSVETWGTEMEVYNFSATQLEENARETEVSVMVSDIRHHFSRSYVHLKKNAVSSDSSVIFAPKGTRREMHTDVVLAGENAHAENIARMVADGGEIINDSSLIGLVKGAKGYLGCDGLMLSDSGEISSTPSVKAKVSEVFLSHEASIGMISEEKMAYLASSGLDEEQARDLIVQGFLDLDKQHIPKALRELVKNMISVARSGSM